MATESTLQLDVKRPEPLVWISRLLIVGSTEPFEVIQSIPLHRGLNIVWSTDTDRGDGESPVMTGHGVGKTTFCRLLRYCLGESSFGQKLLGQRIRSEFPKGMVGAEIRVRGESWAVARPLGRTHNSYAQQGATVEQVLSDRPSPQTYQDFLGHLNRSVLDGLPPQATLSGDKPIIWDHLLAWCARDQEARYQNLWDWRSPRSDSQSPAFIRPKQDALFVVRTALGLVAGEEVELQRQIASADRRLKELEEEVAERRREPQYWAEHLRGELKDRFEIAEAATASFDPGDLFSVPKLIEARRGAIETEVAELEKKAKEVEKTTHLIAAQITEAAQFASARSGATDATSAGTETLAGSVPQLESERQRFADVMDRFCTFGGVSMADCEYVKKQRANLEENIRAASSKTAVTVAERDQLTAAMREAAQRAKQQVSRLQQQFDDLAKQKQTLDSQLSALREDRKALDRVETELHKWQTILEGNTADETLISLQAEQRKLADEKDKAQQALRDTLSAQNSRLGAVRRVFDGLVKAVLSSEFRGIVQIQDGDIQYGITHGSILAGEAVETLAILLTDLSCLLLAAENACVHPGLVIHDSPREADLGGRVYRRFLECMASIHTELGSASAAPFQYIITTTTAPPAALQAGKFLCLRLSTESTDKLLLKRNLGAQAAEDTPLFDVAGRPTIS
jgi:hypothetical protein